MDDLKIETEGGRDAYAPGEQLRGTVTWDLVEPPTSLEVRLFWYTRGKGTTDVRVVKIDRPPAVGRRGRNDFRFVLPESPYSFSGKLISLVWAVEAVAEPGERSARLDLVVAPGAKEIQLQGAPATR